ncbi:hypothetical protein EJ05DRAFT_480271 [Pseudovirgaria hyperparasitica]|uniref:Uncharacterized protein n=1 Tax=Pseudovirgaria hyperparasitica TaxID=470096 RepID=A0A6A6VVS3_9PEZI|nr:uncharacterized protein EJ05DRAFT_480271 [Pseudovirgaria hyperparasitica]KAF2753814.1 hypothetical protein EJ05DRAFT_480271 [Pseudovirgaria hyperparasitica]
MADTISTAPATTAPTEQQSSHRPVSPLEPPPEAAAHTPSPEPQDRSTSASQPPPPPPPAAAAPPPTQSSPLHPPPPHAQAQTYIPPPTPQLTHREKLTTADKHWPWKTGLRTVLLLTAIIGLGTTAAATVSSQHTHHYYGSSWAIVWGLVTFSATTIYTLILLPTFLVRARAPHPGALVATDLLHWLAYIFTALLLTYAAARALAFGADGFISNYYGSSYGEYTLAQNGTWVWNATAYASYYNSDYTRGCEHNSTGTSTYYTSPSPYSYDDDDTSFATCAAQDAYVNTLWNTRHTRQNTLLTAAVCQWLALGLHFILFVWACVDTHRRNAARTSTQAEVLASRIVGNMVRQGVVVPVGYAGGGVGGGYVPMRDMSAGGNGNGNGKGWNNGVDPRVYGWQQPSQQSGSAPAWYNAEGYGMQGQQQWPLPEAIHARDAQAAQMNIPAGKAVYR